MPSMWITRGGFDVLVELTGKFCKGAPERAPSYSHGGLPAEPDTFEDIVAKDVSTGKAMELDEKELARAEVTLLEEHQS